MLVKNGDQVESFRGSVEPSEEKGRESDVAILRFSMW
jgi:hypothetical protein